MQNNFSNYLEMLFSYIGPLEEDKKKNWKQIYFYVYFETFIALFICITVRN